MKLTVSSGVRALVSATAKTLVMITAPANQRLRVMEVAISFDGASATDAPAIIDIARFTTTGTFTSQTPSKIDPGNGETIQSTAGVNASVEPTIGDILKQWHVHPQSGIVHQYVPGDEDVVPGGTRFGIRVKAAANVNAIAYIRFEE